MTWNADHPSASEKKLQDTGRVYVLQLSIFASRQFVSEELVFCLPGNQTASGLDEHPALLQFALRRGRGVDKGDSPGDSCIMPIAKHKLLLLTAFIILLSLAGAGCRGFFVNPKLTSLTVNPASTNLQVGASQQLIATGNYDDGSTKNLNGSSTTWSSADAAHVAVSTAGLATGVATTTSAVTVTANNGGFSGTSSITVGATTITITCDSCTSGNTISITAQGSNPVTFTSNVAANWTSSNSSILSINTTNSTNGSGTLGGTTGSVTITATAASGSGTGSINITVTQ